MTCRMCFDGFCPYCAGTRVRPTYRSVLAHRQAFQDVRGIQQSDPIRPDSPDSSPAQALRSNEIPGTASHYLINDIVHAPSIDRSMDDVSQTEGQDDCRNGQ